jgi:hypothetical protein
VWYTDPESRSIVKGHSSLPLLDELHAVEDRIVARLVELQPVVDEYDELLGAARRLGLDLGSLRRSPAEVHDLSIAPTRRRGGTRAAGAERRRRVIELIGARPGVTVPEISRKLGIDPPPVYRVIRKLQSDGVVVKTGTRLTLA